MSQQPPQEERRIWQWEWCRYTPTFTIKIKRQQDRDPWEHHQDEGPKFTIDEILLQNRDKLSDATKIRIESDKYVFQPFRGPTIQECKALGLMCQHFENVHEVTLSDIWNDNQISTFLGHIRDPKKLTALKIYCKFDYRKEERLVATLQKLNEFSSLEDLSLSGIKVEDEDCSAFGQIVASFRDTSQFSLSAIFPSYRSYLLLFDTIQFNIPVREERFWDTSISGSVIQESTPLQNDDMPEEHRDFYETIKNYTERNHCNAFSNAASQHLWRYARLNRAGRSRFLSNPQGDTTVLQEWVEALANRAVINCIPNLYYFIRMRPDIYAGAALRPIQKANTVGNP